MTNKKKSILVISLFDNVFNIQWECLNTVANHYDFEFILLFKDRKIEKFLNEKKISYHIVDYKTYDKYVKYLPFLRVLLKEIYYFLSFTLISKKIKTQHNILFTNDNSSTIGKYFLRQFQKEGKPSFMYEYGAGLFNKKFIKNIAKKTNKGFAKNLINSIEEKIKYYFIDRNIFYLKSSGYIPHDMGVSYLLVINEISKKNAMEIYNNFEDIINIGNSQFIKYDNVTIKNDNYVLIILSNAYEVAENYGYDKNQYFKNLRKLLLYFKNNQKKVILKHHPNDRIRLYNDVKKEFSIFKWVNHNEESNVDLISKAELVISPMSTLALEVIFIKKPIMFYNYFNQKKEAFEFFNEIFLELPLLDLSKSYISNNQLALSGNINDFGYDKFIKTKSFKKNFINFLSRVVDK